MRRVKQLGEVVVFIAAALAGGGVVLGAIGFAVELVRAGLGVAIGPAWPLRTAAVMLGVGILLAFIGGPLLWFDSLFAPEPKGEPAADLPPPTVAPVDAVRLAVQPGDVVVVRVASSLAPEAREFIRAELLAYLPPGVEVAVLSAGVTLTVLSPARAGDDAGTSEP